MSPANNKGSQADTIIKFITQFSTKILERINCQKPALAAQLLLSIDLYTLLKCKIMKNFLNSLSNMLSQNAI